MTAAHLRSSEKTVHQREEYFRHRTDAEKLLREWDPYVHTMGESKRKIEDDFRAWWKRTRGERWKPNAQGLKEKMLAYVRHSLTDYDAKCDELRRLHGKAGADAFHEMAADMINPKILEAFPFLVVIPRLQKVQRNW